MVTSFLSILSTTSKFSIGHAFHLFKLIFSMVTSLVLLGEKISKNKKKKSKNPKTNGSPKIEKNERGKSGTISRGAQRELHLSCVCVLISALFLIIFLLFTSLDTYGTWKVNRPATNTSTRDTYSASPGSKKFILAKNWSHDPLFRGHKLFVNFKLIFSMVTSFVLLSEEKISKNKMKKSKNPKKQ